ncbi:MAG: VWA domain-containing protein [Planctomycetota bacterium]|nr:VWA domain-containing protein [Planctomycetota bacterium]
MTWLDPFAGLLALAALLPPLVALYFLKLRRKDRTISSTLLWRTATADLRANTPFQRLRFSILLMLQLLVLALLAFALAQPEVSGGARAARHALLVDRSLSMQTKDAGADATRFAEAIEQAHERVAALHGGGFWFGQTPAIMVVSFASTAEVLTGFTDGRAQVDAAIGAIEPTDASTRLADAIALVRAALTPVNPDDPNAAAPDEIVIEVFSDGRIDDIASIALRPEERVLFHPIGKAATSNTAVAAVGVARDPKQPADVKTLARLSHFDTTSRTVDVELLVNGRVRSVLPEPIEIPAQSDDPLLGILPGEIEIAFPPLLLPDGGVIEVRIVESDALKDDDLGAVVAVPPQPLRILLVGGEGFIIRSALESLGPRELMEMTTEEFEAATRADPASLQSFDVIVLHGALPATAPTARYLVFGGGEGISGVEAYGEKSDAFAVGSRPDHPLMRFVSLDELFVHSHQAVAATERGEVIVDGSEGPLVLTITAPGTQVVLVTFDPLDSNWPFQRGFLNFVANSVQWLATFSRPVSDAPFKPGDVVSVMVGAAAIPVSILHPSGEEITVTSGSDGIASVGPLMRTGVWTVKWSGGDRRIAVASRDLMESRVNAVESLEFADETIAGRTSGGLSRSALWPWVLLAAVTLLIVEWWWYLRQV